MKTNTFIVSKVKKKGDKKRNSKKREKKNKRKSKRNDFDILQNDSKAETKEDRFNKKVKLRHQSVSSNAFNTRQQEDERFGTQLNISILNRPNSIKGWFFFL